LVETKTVDGFRIARNRVMGTLTSDYIKQPKMGKGMFEIISASLHPSNALHYAIAAKIVYLWTYRKNEYYTELKTGHIGAVQALTIENVKVVGPGQLMAWQDDPTSLPGNNWFDVTYQRLIA